MKTMAALKLTAMAWRIFCWKVHSSPGVLASDLLMRATQCLTVVYGSSSVGGGAMGVQACIGFASVRNPTKPSSDSPDPNLAGMSSYIRNGLKAFVVSTITSADVTESRAPITRPSVMVGPPCAITHTLTNFHLCH